MAKQLRLRRGTTVQHGSFTGLSGEVTVDTDKDTLAVHDGVTAGGNPLATESGLALKAPIASPTFTGTVSGVTKTHVGLGNVDNTSDATKQTATLSAATKSDVGLSNVDNNSTATIRSGTTAANVGLGSVTNASQATIQAATLSAATKSDVGLSNVDNDSTATIRAGTTKANVGLSAVDNNSTATIRNSLSASNLSSGTIPNARYGTPTFNGSNITNLATGISAPSISSISGTISYGLPGNLTIGMIGYTTTIDLEYFVAGILHTTVSNITAAGSTVVATPSSVYNATDGTMFQIVVKNSDGARSLPVEKINATPPSGGTITTVGSYRVHTFLSSGTFVNTIASLTCEYLIVAGGGGGAQYTTSGGAGGGGVLTGSTSLAKSNHTITIGAASSRSVQGNDTTALSMTALGGGTSGASGGSGGSDAAGTSGQGYAGGSYHHGGGWGGSAGGGGGGSGQVGGNAALHYGGDGGDGVYSAINGTNLQWAGGGGGTIDAYGPTNTAGHGGQGGGGGGSAHAPGSGGTNALNNGENGAYNGVASRGGANTGGGGGACGDPGGGGGGSGIVIVRYII
jgi:hypothetical protein